MKKIKNKTAIILSTCACLLLAALPVGLFALTDAALLARPHARSIPSHTLAPKGEDLYLVRMLQNRASSKKNTGMMGESNQESLYVAMQNSKELMQQGYYVAEMMRAQLENLRAAQVLPQEWYDVLDDQIRKNVNCYMGTDSLGFVQMTCFSPTNEPPYTICTLTLESKTGKIVSFWATRKSVPSTMQPQTTLVFYAQYLQLDMLKDWAPPTGTSFEKSGLYSGFGELLLTCAENNYTDLYAQTQKNAYQYFSLLATPYTEQEMAMKTVTK